MIDFLRRIKTGRGDRRVTPSPFAKRLREKGWFRLLGMLSGLLLSGNTLAADQAITVSAVVLSKSICKFSSASATLSFGTLDPGNPVDVTASTTIGFRCMGSAPVATFLLTDDDGLYESAPNRNRMRHVSLPAAYLPYGMTLSPLTAAVPKNLPQLLTVTGTVLGADYRDVPWGSYTDTVVISINP